MHGARLGFGTVTIYGVRITFRGVVVNGSGPPSGAAWFCGSCYPFAWFCENLMVYGAPLRKSSGLCFPLFLGQFSVWLTAAAPGGGSVA